MSRPVLLVTGASTGIGAAVAELAARRGYDLALHYNVDAEGTGRVAEAARAHGARVEVLQADLADPEGPERLMAGFDAAFPRLDALVNNAGIVGDKAEVAGLTRERVARIMQVNVTAPILLAGAAVRRMRAAGSGGAIVNISSAAARLGSPGEFVDYAASKGAIDTFTKGLALEVAAEGIRVNAVRPGLIETGIHARGGQPDRVERLRHLLPMGRPGTAEEVAEAVLWLLSDAARYTTGSLLDVSGGR